MTTPSSIRLLLCTALLALAGCADGGALQLGDTAEHGPDRCATLDRGTLPDGLVYGGEFTAGLYGAWDDDEDGALSEDEFKDGARTAGALAAWLPLFSTWDTNEDSAIRPIEFVVGSEGTGLFHDLDGDASGVLDRAECRAAL